MPYYEEWILNESTTNWYRSVDGSVVSERANHANVDLVRLRTYRTSPRTARRIEVRELPDSMVDPYTLQMSVPGLKRSAAVARGFDTSLFEEDRGHTFELLRFKSSGPLWSGSMYFKSATGLERVYRGENLDIAEYGVTDWDISPGFAPVGWSNLDSYAQSTYAKAAPLPNSFDLGAFLGELREGLPRFTSEILTKSKTLKGLGSDYLNVEFGWKPFLSDLQSTAEALMGATTALLGPRGPLHRLRSEDPSYSARSFSLEKNLYPTTYVRGHGISRVEPVSNRFFEKFAEPIAPNGLGSADLRLWASVIMSERTESQRWFEGSFTFIPRIGFNPDSYIDRFVELTSPNITPADLWELAPWSWLIDWAVKIGDTIAANEVASDNRIISNYAYAMEKREITRGLLATNIRVGSGNTYAGPSTLTRQWITTGKRRIRANPFGFKPMTTAGLNTGQWLILAALGLTRAGR